MDTVLSPCRRRLLGAFGGLGALALAGCGERARSSGAVVTPLHFGGETMGTTYIVKLAGAALSAARLEALQADVHAALDGVNRAMSLYRPESELMQLNRQPAAVPLALSKDLYEVLAAGQEVSARSQGAFDVSVAPLVNAWGFGPEQRHGVPPGDELQARRTAIGYRGLRLVPEHRTAVKAHTDLQADLGGIAKGYGVDLAARALDAAGAEHYMIEAGGEVRTRGVNAGGQSWRIGIEQPDALPQRARLIVPLSGKAMATSGDYRNYFEADGRRYSHEIDPRTGAPIDHRLCSVTVVADDCMRADALATALLVLGPDRGLRLAESLGLAAYFVERLGPGRYADRQSRAFAVLGGRAA